MIDRSLSKILSSITVAAMLFLATTLVAAGVYMPVRTSSAEGPSPSLSASGYDSDNGINVLISGQNFSPNVQIAISVTDPNGNVDQLSADSSADGSLLTTYWISSLDPLGVYTIIATDPSGATASAEFADPTSDFSAFSIGPVSTTPGASLPWSASAICTGPTTGPNSCTTAGTSVGGNVPDGYTIQLRRADGACSSPGAFATDTSATTASGTASGTTTAPSPLSTTSYCYAVNHPSQTIATKVWGDNTLAPASRITVTVTVASDSIPPSVNSITVNDALITDSDAALDNFQVKVVFSETMKTSVTPTISFSSNPGPTLSSPSGAWSMTTVAADTYTATYNVDDAGVEAGPIDVNVGGAQDAAGNPQDPDPTANNNDLFSIDTKNPTVSISVSQNQIAEADVGTGNFDAVATFSESMDTSATPIVDFGGSACAASTLSFNTGAWSTTTSTDDTYIATYDVTDNNDEGGDCDDIDVSVSGGQDVAGNTQSPDPTTTNDLFSIDTKKPVLTLTDVFIVTTSSQVVTYTQSATDANLVSSPSQPVCTPASGSTFSLGDTTVNCTADDTFGNQATGSFKVTLLKVTGFYQPIDMNGVYNKGKAGNTIPFKFNVYGATEITDTSIFNKIQFTGGTCSTGSGSDTIEVYATGGSSIRYDTTAHQFVYNGATLKSQAGHCYVATLWINGPTVPVATPISALIMLTKT